MFECVYSKSGPRDVYTEVFEAVHPLHRGPTDHKRSVGPLLSLPEVHDQLKKKKKNKKFHDSGDMTMRSWP